MWLATVVVMLGIATAPPLAVAQTPAPAPTAQPATQPASPNQGRLSLSLGVDWTTDYYFRGILQETRSWIVQPYGDLTLKLYEGDGPLSSVFVTAGIWNSFHGGPTGDSGPNAQPKSWYELDFYAKLGATFFSDLTAAVIYTAYTSPNNAFRTVEEVALSLSYNDAKLLGAFALNPSVLLAFETEGQADAGRDRGVYLQLGVAPGLTLFDLVSLSFPVTVGLSLADYYEFGTGSDDTFGYASGGVSASVPLKFIPAAFGTWTAKGNVTVMLLGDNLKRVNRGDSLELIGTFGLALTY
jgi:hypothetical protein